MRPLNPTGAVPRACARPKGASSPAIRVTAGMVFAPKPARWYCDSLSFASATRSGRSTHRRIEGAAVEQKVLPDDEAGRGGAQKSAGITEFCGIADPAGRHSPSSLGQLLL